MNVEKTTADYLEAMLMVQKKYGHIRSVDVAARLGVTKPSVTYTTKRLREAGLITMDDDNLITITEEGMKIARKTFYRHQLLTSFLIEIGVNPEQAEEDACKLEHDFSEESFDLLVKHLETEGHSIPETAEN